VDKSQQLAQRGQLSRSRASQADMDIMTGMTTGIIIIVTVEIIIKMSPVTRLYKRLKQGRVIVRLGQRTAVNYY